MPELKPLFAALGLANPMAVARTLLDSVGHRAELAATEAALARNTLARLVILSLGAFAFFLLAGFAGTFALAASVWDHPHRGLILSVVAWGFALSSLGFLLWSLRMLKSWRPLNETCEQLRRDEAFVRRLLASDEDPTS